MEELQGYPVADDKEIRDAHNKAISLIEHNAQEGQELRRGRPHPR